MQDRIETPPTRNKVEIGYGFIVDRAKRTAKAEILPPYFTVAVYNGGRTRRQVVKAEGTISGLSRRTIRSIPLKISAFSSRRSKGRSYRWS